MSSPISKLLELKKQRTELEALIAAETVAALEDAFTQIDALVEAASITKEQIAEHFHITYIGPSTLGTPSADGPKRKPVDAKYDYQGVQWTGRGKMPKSYRLAIEADPTLSVEQFRIAK